MEILYTITEYPNLSHEQLIMLEELFPKTFSKIETSTNDDYFIFAKNYNKIVGVAMLSSERFEDIITLKMLEVPDEFKGLGIGTRLLKGIFNKAIKNKKRIIFKGVSKGGSKYLNSKVDELQNSVNFQGSIKKFFEKDSISKRAS